MVFVLLRVDFDIPFEAEKILDLTNWVTDPTKIPTKFEVVAKICHVGKSHERGFNSNAII